ncbi:MAG: DUF4870 domain-containing protein [Acidobacteriota bacterium]
MSETGSVGGGKPYADDDKIFLFLAYFGIFSLIPFFMYRDKRSDPQKEYVYWHSRQGLGLTIVAVIVWICGMVGMFIPFLNILVGLVLCVWWILVLVMMIMGWVKAFGGQKWEMPGISKVAQMFN